MIYRSPNSIGSLFFNCPIRRTVTVKTCNIYKKQHGARPCVAFSLYLQMKEGTLHPQKFGCTPKNDGKRVHVPPDEKTCGHADIKHRFFYFQFYIFFLRKKLGSYGV